jgi:hypothetical protein
MSLGHSLDPAGINDITASATGSGQELNVLRSISMGRPEILREMCCWPQDSHEASSWTLMRRAVVVC